MCKPWSSPSVRIRSKVETKSCSWSTASPWILWWWRESVWCSHFPPMGVKEWKLQVRPCSDQVPRLELMGYLTLARMYDTCRMSLQIANIQDYKRIFWVDSSTVLSWIRTPSRQFKPFVSARVAEIQETVGVDDFRYIRSKSNPADILTRGTEPS